MLVKIFLFCLAFLPFIVSAQTVEVKKETRRPEGKNTTGYQVTFAAQEEEVRNSLTKYLKALGKTKLTGEYITMEDPVMGGKKYAHTLYATTRSAGNMTSVWIGSSPADAAEPVAEGDLQTFVHDFGVHFQRAQIQAQIDESLRALQAVEKRQSRLLNQNKDLRTKMENNKRQKAQLEKSMEENKLEFSDLTEKLDTNNSAQDSVATATGQIKKVVEMHLEKQRQVH